MKSCNSRKKCSVCEVSKSTDEFYKTGKNEWSIRADCKDCVKSYRKQHRKDNPKNYKEIEARRKAKWAKKYPERCRNSRLKYTYGIDQEEYDRILKAQGGVCAICERPERKILKSTGKPKRLSVDHCHKTGKVRGLLCFYCNASLGKFNDSIEILKNAIKYLEKAQGENDG